MMWKKKKQPEASALCATCGVKRRLRETVITPRYGWMEVVGMHAEIESLTLDRGYVVAVATFVTSVSVTVTPDDKITLFGVDQSVVHVTQDTFDQPITVMPQDTLEVTVQLEPHSLVKMERWVNFS
jgi:hypothetical protein